MASPRCAGPTFVMSLASISTCPEVTSSRPAMRRRSVDFPQPDGPTNTANSPFSILRSTPLMTLTAPNAFSTDFSWMLPIVAYPFRKSLDGAEGQTSDELLLREPAENENRRDRERRSRRKLRPEKPFRRGVGGNEGRQRSGVRGRQIERPERFVPRQDDGEKHRR